MLEIEFDDWISSGHRLTLRALTHGVVPYRGTAPEQHLTRSDLRAHRIFKTTRSRDGEGPLHRGDTKADCVELKIQNLTIIVA